MTIKINKIILILIINLVIQCNINAQLINSLGVPHVQQVACCRDNCIGTRPKLHYLGCGYYSLGMIMSYFDTKKYGTLPYTISNIDLIAQSIQNNNYITACLAPTPLSSLLANFAMQHGVYAETKRGNNSDDFEMWKQLIIREINNGNPLMVNVFATDRKKKDWTYFNTEVRHWVVIDGYDYNGINMQDPGTQNGHNNIVPWNYLETAWSKNRYNCIIFGLNAKNNNSPFDNSTNVSMPVTFNWSDKQWINVEYRIQVAKNPSNWTAQNGFTSNKIPDDNVVVNTNTKSLSEFTWQKSCIGLDQYLNIFPGISLLGGCNIGGSTYESPVPLTTYYWTYKAYSPSTGSTTYSNYQKFTTITNFTVGDGIDVPSITIRDCYLNTESLNLNENIVFNVEIENESSSNEDIILKLIIDGQFVDSKPINLNSNSVIKTTMSHTFTDIGQHDVSFMAVCSSSYPDILGFTINVLPNVVQKYLSLSSNYWDAPDGTYLGYSINYTTNTLINVVSSDSWLKFNYDENTILLSAYANTSKYNRTGYIYINGEGIEQKIITVTQKGVMPYIKLDPKVLTFYSHDSHIGVIVYSNIKNWKAISNQDWLVATKLDTLLLYVTATENTSTNSRYATIDFYDSTNIIKTYNVEQLGNSLTLSSEQVYVDSKSGSYSLYYYSNNPCSVTLENSKDDWMFDYSVSDNIVKISYNTNKSVEARVGTLLITASNGDSRRFSIYQAGNTPNVNIYPDTLIIACNKGKIGFSYCLGNCDIIRDPIADYVINISSSCPSLNITPNNNWLSLDINKDLNFDFNFSSSQRKANVSFDCMGTMHPLTIIQESCMSKDIIKGGNILCKDNLLTSNGIFNSYNWSTGETSSSITYPSDYYEYVYLVANYKGVYYIDSAKVLLKPYLNLRDHSMTFCENDSRNIQIYSSFDSIFWYDSKKNYIGSTGSDIIINSRTNRHLYNSAEVFDGDEIFFKANNTSEYLYVTTNKTVNNCYLKDSIKVSMVFLNEPAILLEKLDDKNRIKLSSNNVYDSYDWTICDTTLSNCSKSGLSLSTCDTSLVNGCYWFDLYATYNKNGCDFTVVIDTTLCLMKPTEISVNDTQFGFCKIYPNPVESILSIESELPINSVKLFNTLGVIEFQVTNINSKSLHIDLSKLSSGVYGLIIFLKNNLREPIESKIIKK